MDKEFEEWLNNSNVKYNQINDSDEYRFYIKTYEGYEGIAAN